MSAPPFDDFFVSISGPTMSIDPALVSVISAGTALVASITGPMVTLYVACAQIRAAVRSANRQRWIEEFRDLVAHLGGQVAASMQVRGQVIHDGKVVITGERKLVEQLERLVYTFNKIHLLINLLDPQHVELIETTSRFLMQFRTASMADDLQSEAEAAVKRIVDMSLTIVRREWLRVQRGA